MEIEIKTEVLGDFPIAGPNAVKTAAQYKGFYSAIRRANVAGFLLPVSIAGL
jgi:hypothetical protein